MFRKIIAATAVLAVAVGSQAQTATFSMTGTVNPASCAISLGGGGLANFGVSTSVAVRANTQKSGANVHYDMGTRTFTWNVVCTAATPLQLAFNDGKAGSVLAIDANDAQRFGLVDGVSGATSIGSYTVTMAASNTTVDNIPVMGFLSATTGSALGWNNNYAGAAVPGRATGFAKNTGQTTPSTLTTASGTMSVNVLLGKTYADNATTAITLNGAGSITLQYL
jgi:Protein of unknown function (DUF1120)